MDVLVGLSFAAAKWDNQTIFADAVKRMTVKCSSMLFGRDEVDTRRIRVPSTRWAGMRSFDSDV